MALSKNAKSYLYVMLADAEGKLLAEIEAKIQSAAPLSQAALDILIDAMGESKAAKEIAALIANHGQMSAHAYSWLVAALTNKAAADEIKAILAS